VQWRLFWATVAAVFALAAPAQAGVVQSWTHAEAAAKTNPNGTNNEDAQIIRHLLWHNSRLWAGYGDDVANVGPIVYKGLNVNTGGWSPTTSLQTEEVSMSREFAQAGTVKQFIPFQDPQGAAAADEDYAFGLGPTLTQDDGFGGAHIFDVTREPGTDDIWACGMDLQDDAAVWESTDDGVNWTQTHEVLNDVGGNMRHYGCTFTGSTFYTIESDWNGSSHDPPVLWTWNAGSGWQSDTTPPGDPFASYKNTDWAGDQYALEKLPGTTGTANLIGLIGGDTGVNAEDIAAGTTDFYRLDGATVYKTTTPANSGSWVSAATGVPADAQSVEVSGSRVFVGRANGVISEVN
jgi:hypothetical protein